MASTATRRGSSIISRLGSKICRRNRLLALGSRLGGEARWGFTPADPKGTPVRKITGIGSTRIVVRNRFTWSPCRLASDAQLKAMAPVHKKSFAARFPQLSHVEMEYCWGGLLCFSLNGVSVFGEVENSLISACCQNGLGAAKGTSNGMLSEELACGIASPHLEFLLNEADSKRLPPEPFSSIGANAYMRWAEYKADLEL